MKYNHLYEIQSTNPVSTNTNRIRDILNIPINYGAFPSFFFKIHPDYLAFFQNLGIDSDHFLFRNPMFDNTFIDFDLFMVSEYVGDDYYILNEKNLFQTDPNYPLRILQENIKLWAVNRDYLVQGIQSLNEFARNEFHEGYKSDLDSILHEKGLL